MTRANSTASRRRRSTKTSRRTFLGSLCSTAAAVPFLRSFTVGAQDDGLVPLPKVLFVGFPNGPLVGPTGGSGYAGWRPASASAGDTPLPLDEAGFPHIFKPLHPFRDRLVFLENIAWIDGANPHRQTSALLTGRRRYVAGDIKDYTSTGISIDHYLANQFAGDPDLATNVLNTAFRIQGYVPGESYWSYTGPGERVEPIQNPVDTYQRVFGEGLDQTELELVIDRRKSVLDVIAKDLGRMMSRVPAADRPRLEQHLDSVHQVEQSLQAAVCEGGAPLSDYDFLAHANGPRVMRDHAELIAQGMACGHTRIATLQFSAFGGPCRPDWAELGIAHSGHDEHAICHAFAGIESPGGGPLSQQAGRDLGVAKEVAFSKMFADVLARLEATPDIDGSSLLDNTMVVYVRPMGRNHDSDRILWIVAGGAGAGVNGGRWLQFADDEKHYNDVLTAVCNRMGHPVDTFGEAQFCDTPVPLG
ncbi:DUF1552 domain-containing protein [Paraliomyxa miuraensis]|uniref:DUF1552 domain-containing protein n=1 Tax=Paraliomyxa miuraensis TaxID=376150 RepID=UPI002256419E|nr:DUF1552 domain-containing protein [Paraliomyxa miuraensis]MCX4241660.1 DUF1552 domain-containing protein [Paraliomyxa miuraensis]